MLRNVELDLSGDESVYPAGRQPGWWHRSDTQDHEDRGKGSGKIALADQDYLKRSDNNAKAKWSTGRAEVSIATVKAVPLLAYQGLQSVKLIADFTAEDLARLVDYHQKKASEVIQFPDNIKIPENCGRYFSH